MKYSQYDNPAATSQSWGKSLNRHQLPAVVSGRSYQLETIHQDKNAAASFQIPTDASILEPWTHESCIMPEVGNGA